MSDRSWFFASQGKEQGPYPEAQLREFIANGTVTADTLVWSEGMAGWHKARDIPGLLAGASGLPPVPQHGRLLASGGPPSIDLRILEFTWRSVVAWIGLLVVIPLPC